MTEQPTLTCGLLVWDRKATKAAGQVVFRTCGASTRGTVTILGDAFVAACGRHRARIERLDRKLRSLPFRT